MHLPAALLLLLLLHSAESGRAARHYGARGHPWGGGKVRRQAQECKEYIEAGEKYLDCQDQQLTTVMQDWPTDIQHLLLARNKFQVLRDNMFSQFTRLKSLDLQQNDISMVEDGAFAGLTQLTTLLLQHNGLRTASEEMLLPMPRLSYLRVYDNPWNCDCALDSLVRTMQLPSNRNLGNYAKCAEPLSMRGYKMRKINVELLCAPDRDGEVPSRPQIKVKPEVTSICRTYLFPKPLLDCSSKDLNHVPSGLPSDIVKMDLSGNNIKHLKPQQFLMSKDLKLLNLSSNSLQHIDTAAFAGLLYLRELDLSNNSLHNFQYGVLEDLYFLRKLSLGNNPWICDYNIHYLIYWLKHHPGVQYSGLTCAEPDEFARPDIKRHTCTLILFERSSPRSPGTCPDLGRTRFTWGADLSPLGPLHLQNTDPQLELIEVEILGNSPAELVEFSGSDSDLLSSAHALLKERSQTQRRASFAFIPPLFFFSYADYKEGYK